MLFLIVIGLKISSAIAVPRDTLGSDDVIPAGAVMVGFVVSVIVIFWFFVTEFFAASVAIGILLLFVWLFAFAHKKEYEQY